MGPRPWGRESLQIPLRTPGPSPQCAGDGTHPTGTYPASAGRRRQLQGCGKAQRALLRDIRKAGQAKGVQPLLELVMRHRAEFGETFSRRFCLASLPGCPPAIPLYERAFGPLSPFERERYQALHAELNRDYPQAGVHWQCCLEHLQAASGGVQEPLTEALIHRHIAELATLDVPRIAIDHLEKSLKVDPDDKPTYLHLIKLYERLEEAKTAQIWLNRALEQYPKDPEVLILAMQSAQRRKAFKQVVAYAKTLLDIDPINRQARRFLLEAHLAHARKLLKSKNPGRPRRSWPSPANWIPSAAMPPCSISKVC